MMADETLFRLALVGDVALGNHPKTPGFGFYSRYIQGIPKILCQRILPAGVRPDVLFGNLEFALANDARHPGTNACCLGSDTYVRFLRESGFTVLNVANNHAWQYGDAFFRETVNALKGTGIKVVGIPDDFEPAGFVQIKGSTVAFLGCSARPRQGFQGSPGYNEFDEGGFLQRIRDARRHADLVCVSVHWGEEFLPIASPWERGIAHAMIDAGAAVVVGHHPHILKEIETWRDGLIAYSLGNFIGDMIWNPVTRETGCLIVEARNSRVISNTFFPAAIERDFFPLYLDPPSSRKILEERTARHARLAIQLKSFPYESLARRALRRHQWLTLGFVLRNVFRYRLATLAEILYEAMKVRLQRYQRVRP